MRTRHFLPAALGAVLCASLPAQWLPVYEKAGPEAGSSFAGAMTRLIDRDADTYPELLVGAIGADANGLNSGAVYVLEGESGNLLLTVPGETAGGLFGAAVTAMSDLNQDGVQDFAVSAPFFTGSGGFFSGRVYVVDGATGAFLDTVDGPLMGSMFGTGLAATDVDGDGVAELAVGAPGDAGGDGSVTFYQWSGGALNQIGQVYGAPGSLEWFGFAIEDLGDLVGGPAHELVVGAPYADDGGVDSGSVSALTWLGGPTEIRSFAPAVPGAMAGYSVDATMNGLNGYVAAGAPGTANGSVFIWNGRTQALLVTIDGEAAGDHFGWAVEFLQDHNFDGDVEIAVGAPEANGAGRGYVYDFLEAGGPAQLLVVDGTAGSRLGASVAQTGDINGSTFSDLAFGAPDADSGLGGRQGRYVVWSPPDSNLPPPVLTLLNPPVLDSQVGIRVENIKEGADLYLYAGTSNTPGTTAEGFQLDISSYFGGSGGHDYFELATNVTGGVYQTPFQLPISIAPGTTVVFQAVEVRGIFERLSSVDGGVVADRPLEFDISPPLTVNQTSTFTTRYAHRDPAAIVYYFMGLNQGDAKYFGISTGLSNPYVIIDANGSHPDQYGFVTYDWQVPTQMNGTPLQGKTVLLSSVSWFQGDERIGYFGPTTIQ
ncbi:MAG: hypothetical protein D6702_07055 [Planctomycetota bacterium]|nr:MAG: hypothetical protein D6702_07055 [Planctomycetota bacterium]